jgi:hypothetical protein
LNPGYDPDKYSTAGTGVRSAPPDCAERLAEVNVLLAATGLMRAGV